jgi:hypothetical protein
MTNKIALGKVAWAQTLQGFLITDVAVRDRNIVYVCSRKKMTADAASGMLDSEVPSRITAVFLDDTSDDNFANQQIVGMNQPSVGVFRLDAAGPTGLLASMSRDGNVWPLGSMGSGPMEQIAPGQSPGTTRLKCIDGYTYSIGGGREIYRRTAVGTWEAFVQKGLVLSKDVPNRESMSTSRWLDVFSAMGFNDLDAFSARDMYAVGGHGDVWHFDGTTWMQMGFPSNVQLGTVTCAGDGNVYISGEGGSLWVGSKSTWTRVYEGSSSILWNDVLWFNGQLWLASDYQFRTWDGKEMQLVTHEGKSVNMFGHMDAYDGILAIASPEWVKTFDGKEWRTIVAPYLE